MDRQTARDIRRAPLSTPSRLPAEAVKEIAGGLTLFRADIFSLYIKTKNFHWHMSGPHFRDYHLLLDEQGEELFAMTDAVAERARKVGGTTLPSIGHIGRLQRLRNNNADYVTPEDMLAELREDNGQFVEYLRRLHELTSEHSDFASTSLIENWIDERKRRLWFLFEATRALAVWSVRMSGKEKQ